MTAPAVTIGVGFNLPGPNDPVGYLDLPGTTGSYASVPDEAALDITGDIEIVARVMLDDWTPATTNAIVAKFASSNRDYWLEVRTDGKIKLGSSADGLTLRDNFSTVAPSFTNGSWYWVKATRASASGNVIFYTAEDQNDEPSSWTQLGTTVAGTAGAIHAGTSQLWLGGLSGATGWLAGAIKRVIVRNGIGGTAVFDVDFSDVASGVSSVTASTGQTVTIAGSAATVAATGSDFVVGDATAGLVGSGTYLLADGFFDIQADAYRVNITRGRSSTLFEDVPAGTMQVGLFDLDRTYDPEYVSSPYAGEIIPGKPCRVQVDGVTVATMTVDDWNITYTPQADIADVEFTGVDVLGELASMEFDEWTTTAGQLPGARLQDVCDRSEVGLDGIRRVFDAGVSTLQADTVSWGSNVLNYAQLVAASDLGLLFGDVDNRLAFTSRASLITGTSVASFADDGSGIPFQGIAATVGGDLLYSSVSVDREGGTQQTATVADTGQFKVEYGFLRRLSISGLLLESDTQSADLAAALLARYQTPEYRISEIRVAVSALEGTDRTDVLGIEIGDLVDVTFTPLGVGSAITQTLLVQGIGWDITPEECWVRFSLIDADRRAFFILDSSAYGVVDTNLIGF